MSKIIRASDVFLKAGIKSPGIPLFTDRIIQTSCPTCKEQQTLDLCRLYEKNGETFYECKNRCQVIVIISNPGEKPIPGRGYRLKDHVIRNVSDIVILTLEGSNVLIPSSPAALD